MSGQSVRHRCKSCLPDVLSVVCPCTVAQRGCPLVFCVFRGGPHGQLGMDRVLGAGSAALRAEPSPVQVVPPELTGLIASASISTSHAGSSRDLTTTAVAAGLIWAKASPCARATSGQYSASVRYIRVRTTLVRSAPALPSASLISARHSFAWPYASAGGAEPSAGMGAVPATTTRLPATTARENPNSASYGECP